MKVGNVLALLFLVWTSNVQADAGSTSDGGNGGFAYRHASPLIIRAIDETSRRLDCLPESLTRRYGIDRSVLAQALNPSAVHLSDTTDRTRNGQPLELDYQTAPSCQLSVLRPLFQAVESRSSRDDLLVISELAEKLLHEAGHCFGLDEERSAQWAREASDSEGIGRHPLFAHTRGIKENVYFIRGRAGNSGERRPTSHRRNTLSLGVFRVGESVDVNVMATTDWVPHINYRPGIRASVPYHDWIREQECRDVSFSINITEDEGAWLSETLYPNLRNARMDPQRDFSETLCLGSTIVRIPLLQCSSI